MPVEEKTELVEVADVTLVPMSELDAVVVVVSDLATSVVEVLDKLFVDDGPASVVELGSKKGLGVAYAVPSPP